MRLWWSLRKRLARLSPAPRRLRRLGAMWELDPTDWLDLRLIVGQPFEDAQRERFAEMIGARRPETLYDVGANIGLYAVVMALRFPWLQVEAFEPVGRTRARLALHVGLNALEERVRVRPVALSDREGTANIAVDPRSSGLSTLSAEAPEQMRRDFTRTETVRTARLDDLAAGAGRTLAFKIDVEGHETRTLAGMACILRDSQGVLQIELRPRNAPEARRLLEEAGWRETGRIDEEHYFEKP